MGENALKLESAANYGTMPFESHWYADQHTKYESFIFPDYIFSQTKFVKTLSDDYEIWEVSGFAFLNGKVWPTVFEQPKYVLVRVNTLVIKRDQLNRNRREGKVEFLLKVCINNRNDRALSMLENYYWVRIKHVEKNN